MDEWGTTSFASCGPLSGRCTTGRGTSSRATTTASMTSTHCSTSVETATASLHHHLHHRKHLSHRVVASTHTYVAHAWLVLALVNNCDLPAFEERIIMHLCFHDWLFWYKFNESIAKRGHKLSKLTLWVCLSSFQQVWWRDWFLHNHWSVA